MYYQNKLQKGDPIQVKFNLSKRIENKLFKKRKNRKIKSRKKR